MIWRERPELRAPVMVCAFKGWNDAGEAATAALSYIRGSFDARDVAEIDPEEYYDFTAVRPTVRLTEGDVRKIEWPENKVAVAPVQGADERPRAVPRSGALAPLAALHRRGDRRGAASSA